MALLPHIAALANVNLMVVSWDPFTNSSSQHHTEVEPDTFAFGSTIVSAFQAGRFWNGGSSDIGFATSVDGGVTYRHGFLRGVTVFAGGHYDRASDPTVAFDARHDVWLISFLGFRTPNPSLVSSFTSDVLVSRSTDGGLSWSGPIVVYGAPHYLDKNWTVCDDTPTSAFFGHCYTEFDDNFYGDLIEMSTSTNGGLSWAYPRATANRAKGIAGQPLVKPGGRVVVPILNAAQNTLLSFISTDGGSSWNSTVVITGVRHHRSAGGLRGGALPSAEMDRSGMTYLTWEDCRFRSYCSGNDIVMSKSSDGLSWSAVSRVPIDSVGSGRDHFLPGLGVDRATTGSSAHLGLTYYFYPVSACTTSTCQLYVGFISSRNGGASWNAPIQLAGPMYLTWLPSTNIGYMVGDYISTSFIGGAAHTVFPVARAPSSGFRHMPMYTPTMGLS
jgi:hypothetical protein